MHDTDFSVPLGWTIYIYILNHILNKITVIPRISFVGRKKSEYPEKTTELPKSRTRFITNNSIEYTQYRLEFYSQFEWSTDTDCICKLDSNHHAIAASMPVLYFTNTFIISDSDTFCFVCSPLKRKSGYRITQIFLKLLELLPLLWCVAGIQI